MANSESSFQSEIQQNLRTAGYHSVKVSDRIKYGILDLWVSGPAGRGWIELKYEDALKTDTTVKVNLTSHQRLFIRTEQGVGGVAGWALCVRITPRQWALICGHDPEVVRADWETPGMVYGLGQPHQVWHRLPGQPWPVEAAMAYLLGGR